MLGLLWNLRPMADFELPIRRVEELSSLRMQNDLTGKITVESYW
jgi:hypothetical protein